MQRTYHGLANDGRDTRAIQHYLGHRNIMHTVRYTELASDQVSAYALAKAIRVPTDFWMNLQSHYDLTVASRRDAARIEKEVAVYAKLG